ncbi:MAG: colanic acid biosynthesis glycosyltransferase WcaL [Leptolyngbya foveolarum]|uniref:Colanic acid biosynthesis glycosyltransferase WcaL n=1 Tax=Leptolyngbya foveolarum TaxID=47253 RepID=A0A2W4UPH3_9CYAN|nr:MAG: colanic acid biosynthesis glycosyltransferase WcaL [Leptolyngbya foveolarum]
MKVAFIVEGFPKISETFVMSQIIGLIERGHEVDVYADSPVNEEVRSGDYKQEDLLNIHYLKNSSDKLSNLFHAFRSSTLNFFKNPKAISCAWNPKKYDEPRVFPRFLLPLLTTAFIRNSRDYDIIHCHFGHNGLKAAFLKRIGLIDSKVVTTFHGIDLTSYISSFGQDTYARLFEYGNLFLPISERWEQRLIELGCDHNKINIHHMGVDCEKFVFKHRNLEENSQVRLISIARLVEKKGIEYAIRAIAQLVKVYPNIHYTIIGDGLLRQNLEDLAKELQIEQQVDFLGWREHREVIDILDRSNILLAPSVTSREGDQEGIPVTLMEAMAMGIPVISTWHSGIPELVKDKISGYLVAERDIDALAQKIECLINQPEVYSSMSLQGRMCVEKSYDLDRLNDQLVNIYTKLLSEGK